jgi:peptidoglycan/LPS O-acetylase OafA/YrhL
LSLQTDLTLSHPKYRADIDGLRAVAVLSVLAFHAFPDVMKAGFIGVDVFFVISGFLISSIIFENLDRGTFSFAEFYGRRIKRIFPALSLVLLSCLVFGWFGLLEDEYKQLGKHVAAGSAFISNFALWQESGYFNNAAETKPLLHLWSLAIEEQFYIVWPLLMWLVWRRKLLFWLVFAALLISSFAISVYLVRVDRVAAFYFPGSRVWELLAGVLLAYLAVRPSRWQPSSWHRNLASVLGASLIALAFFKIDKNRPYPGSWALLPELGAFLIVFAGSAAWFNRFVLSNKWLVWVGLISFPLYLWHWPILSFMRIVESETPHMSYRIMALALSFLLAWLTYRFVEKPIRTGSYSGTKTLSLIGLIVALGLTGWAIFQNNGMPNRVAAKSDGVNVWDNLAFAGSCNSITHAADEDDWCNMGNAPAKAPTTLLMGDSVGNGFAPMLQAYAEQSGDKDFVFKQLGRGACNGLPKIGMPNCEALIAAADAYIAQTPSIHTIIMAANWSLYSSGYDREGLTAITAAQFKKAFEERLTHYQKLGKRVIVFWAPPVGASPRACVVRPIRLTAKNTCVLARADADNNEHHYKAGFAPFLENRGVATFDPFKYMCDDTSCKVTDGTQIYYLDHEHFSNFGGQFLAKAAGEELKQLLSPPLKTTP